MTIKDAPIPELIQRARRAVELEAPAVLAAAQRYANAPQKGSPRRMDTARVKRVTGRKGQAQRDIVNLTQHTARLLFTSFYDHLVSFGRLLGSDSMVSVFAHTTVSRAACEAAVRCAWLLDPQISSEERMVRSAVIIFNGSEDRVRGAKLTLALTDRQDVVQNCVEDRVKCHDLIKSAGMRFERDRRGKETASISYPQARAKVPVKINVTDLMSQYLPGVPGWYLIGSGAAHSLPWSLQDAVADPTDAAKLVVSPSPLEAAAGAEAALDSAALLTQTYAHYFGHDPKAEMRAHRQRRGMIDRLMQEYGSPQLQARLRGLAT